MCSTTNRKNTSAVHLLWMLFSCTSFEVPPVQAALHGFPDICCTFPFCVAGKGSGMEKALPRPLWPHGKGGEQSVRSPPATVGHICGQLSPRCSLRRCAAWPASALCCTSPHCYLKFLTRLNLKIGHKKQPKKMHFLLTHYVPSVPPLPFPDYLY